MCWLVGQSSQQPEAAVITATCVLLMPASHVHRHPCPIVPLSCRDALFLGDCDAGVRQLCRLLGWEGELDGLLAESQRDWQPPERPAADAAIAAAAAAAAGGGGEK